MNQDSVWFSAGDNAQIFGEDVVEVDSFYQVLIPIVDPQFFSDQFRFRFVATGRQTGLLDTWLIDYVYLNDGRSISDDRYPDRTFTRPLSSAFKNYYSIPIDHFFTDPDLFLGNVGNQFKNLGGKDSQGIVNQNFEYKVDFEIIYTNVNDVIMSTPIQQLLDDEGDENDDDINGLKALERKDFIVDSLVKITDLPSNAKRAEFNYLMRLIRGDSISDIHDNIDFRTNDTIRNTFILDNYYAYDDGTAERGAGVNLSGSQLAYRFIKPSENIDSVSAFDIYFPNTVENIQFGKQVILKIWGNSNDLPANELFSSEILIQKVDTLNQFYRYELEEKISVADTFYIGWEQMTADRIFVGLDKNTESSDRIFFNISGDWEQNNNDIIGSLMLRPVFGEVFVDPNATVTGINGEDFQSTITLYPNPTSGIIHIQGEYDQVDILTLNGKRMNPPIITEGTNTMINLFGLPSGIYIVRIRKDNQFINKKIILNQ